MCKPGGVVPNPDYDPANIEPGIQGTNIGHIYQKRLKMLQYNILHLERIQHPMMPGTFKCNTMKQAKDNKKENKMPAKLTKIDKVREFLENLDDYLYLTLGSVGFLLAYVVWEQVVLSADDPSYGLPSPTEEMIARGPHTEPQFDLDNKAVWQVVQHCTHGGPGWSWAQSCQCACDGRG
jgi:hypothetical protein